MNLKNNKGFAGVDISISIILILIFVPTLFGAIYSIQRNNNWVKRESQAIRIASDVLEIAKAQDYDDVTFESNSNFVESLNTKYGNCNISSNTAECSCTGQDGEYYKINVDVSNYYPTGTESSEDLVKKVNVIVTYMLGNDEKTVEIATVLQKT